MSYNDLDATTEEEKYSRSGYGGPAEQEVVAGTPEGDRPDGSRGAMEGQAGYVYFVETVDGAFVKIGYSKRVYGRLSELSTLRPGNFAIRMIGYFPGTVQTEAWLHVKFSADRDNGEWFRSTEALRSFIASIGLIEPVVRPVPPVRRRVQRKLQRIIIETAETRPITATANQPATTEMISRVFSMMGKKGGPARAESLTEERRKEIARGGAAARWKNKERAERPTGTPPTVPPYAEGDSGKNNA